MLFPLCNLLLQVSHPFWYSAHWSYWNTQFLSLPPVCHTLLSMFWTWSVFSIYPLGSYTPQLLYPTYRNTPKKWITVFCSRSQLLQLPGLSYKQEVYVMFLWVGLRWLHMISIRLILSLLLSGNWLMLSPWSSSDWSVTDSHASYFDTLRSGP